MLAGSAIYSFEMVRQNGTKVIGLVKEREEAKRDLNAALAAGQTAALGEEQTKDVFSIELGNIGPNEVITINLSYISPLSDDEAKNQVRFTLPRTYMQRYGSVPTAKVSNSLGHEDVPFTMNVVVQQADRITNVKTLSGYDVDLSLGRPAGLDPSFGEHANFASLVVRRSSKAGPSRDLILIITADGLDTPRAFVESHPSPDHRTTAIGLTLVPTFEPMDSPLGMEYIVLVDRSGSMTGVKMQMTQAAIKLLMKTLPTQKSYMNIFSYGTEVDSLWPQSKPYDEPTVDIATRYINAMTANYGGTDIPKALDAVFNSLPARLVRPVSIFLLTDGGTWDVKACMEKTEKIIRERSTVDQFMRVFTIGLGDGVSTETCDGIARAGNGASVYIVSPDESYLGKCARIVRAARQAPVTDVTVSWQAAWQDNPQYECGPPANTASNEPVDLFQADHEYSTANTGPQGRAEQAPYTIPTFFPASRTQIYTFLPKENFNRRASIVVSGRIPALNNRPVRVTVPIRNLLYSQGTAIMHKITARALITQFEDGKYPGPPESLKEDIIRLGIKHNLSSRHTSFLAVDNGRPVSIAATWNSAMPMPGFDNDEPKFKSADLAATTRGIDVQSFSSGADLMTGEDDENDVATTIPEILVKLARYQSFDGGFSGKAASVFGLLNPLGGDTAQPVFEKYSLSDEISAALLVWAWVDTFCGVVGADIKSKANAWARENAKGVDIDAVQRELLEEVAFDVV